ncbi:hypothetical protein GF386_00950 [Candidatus Pacearchaeota archaeon]|nr:hypothetical protein [Candidatus Pacearchaeota archaeon]MBD3282803.1 hypothetical protein [Candidatus Pacearchaeota archaeon]
MKNEGVDLHIHSIYSDGTFFPKEILNLALKKGLKFFSITDHNCIGFYFRYPRFIPGIEISIEDIFNEKPVKGLEILGYGFDTTKMKDKIKPFQKNKMDNIKKCIDNFNKFDFQSNLFSLKSFKEAKIRDFFEFRCKRKLSEQEFRDLLENSAPTKIDLAEFLYSKFFDFNPETWKIHGNLPFLFKREFSDTIFRTEESKKMTFRDAIGLVKESEGTAVLAHPAMCNLFAKKWFKQKSEGVDPFEFIKNLKENYGLDGVELYNYGGVLKYSKPSVELINLYFKDVSKRLNLVNTFGSDCHGDKWWGFQLGSFNSDIKEIQKFLNYVYKNT